PIGLKDKNPRKRKGTEKNFGHDESVLDETQDINTSPEEEMNDINKEMSINYSQTPILWDQNEIGYIDEIFSYSIASDIMSSDDDPEPKSVKPLSTPMVGRSLNVDNDPFRPCEDDEEVLGPEVPYLSAIGALMYLTNCTRSNISFVVNLLARFSSSPTKGIGMESNTFFKVNLGLFYPDDSKEGLVGYADAGYLLDPHKARSQTRYVFLNGGTAILWRS
ncbi:hypothetical protein Tco_1432991, partial [Tanacetum coccineum]